MLSAVRPSLSFLLSIFGLLSAVAAAAAQAAEVAVQNLRLWHAPDHTRLVFDLSGPLEHRLFALKDPPRLVVDLENARLEGTLPQETDLGTRLAAIRAGRPEAGVLRVVLDLKDTLHPRSFVLKPAGPYGHRLVIDLYDAAGAPPSARPGRPPATAERTTPPPAAAREFVVAIDAGHGGEDPGAIGRRYRTREKDVTLAIARELHRLVEATPGMRAVLIRDGDYFIPLHRRTEIARTARADVFISIHADSLPGRSTRARGSSVYALSERGATSALAKALADEENAADWIGGAAPEEADDQLKKVLGDLTKTATIADSLELGADILAALGEIGPLHSDTVAQAGFVVLKSPIPSVLVETAFLSNPDEERKLRDHRFQERLARGIYNGLKRAAPRLIARRAHLPPLDVARAAPPLPAPTTPPPGRVRIHVVQPGETLSAIARRYDVDVEVLRFANDLAGDVLPPGARLQIP
jgi:N-acetylmuramoyl-L-alanine amidase